jgi:hypothetical protein
MDTFSALTDLKYLNLADNSIEQLTYSTENPLALLERLDLSRNHIRYLFDPVKFALMPMLREVDCADNHLMDASGLGTAFTDTDPIEVFYLDNNWLIQSQLDEELPGLLALDVIIQKVVETDCSMYTYKNYLWSGVMCTYESAIEQESDPHSDLYCLPLYTQIDGLKNGLQSQINDLQTVVSELIAQGVCHLTAGEMLGIILTGLDDACHQAYEWGDNQIVKYQTKIDNLNELIRSIDRIGMCKQHTC